MFRQSTLAVLVLGMLTHALALPAFVLYMSSGSSPNFVNVYSGDSSGKLTFATRVATAGSATGVQSQHSVVVTGNYLLALNTLSNTVVLFHINADHPTQLTMLGTPQDTKGDWPLSIATHGDYACVANSGPRNTITCYTITSHGLVPVAGSTRQLGLSLTLPPVSHTGPGQISFLPDGSALVLSIKSPPPAFSVLVFPFASGLPSATPAHSTATGTDNFAFAFDLDGTIILADTQPFGGGVTDSGLQLVTVSSQHGGSATFDLPTYWEVSGTSGVCWIERSPQTGRFYTGDAGSHAISEISRVGPVINLINNYPIPGGCTDIVVVSLPDQDYVFTNAGGTQTIGGLKLSRATFATTLTPYSYANDGVVAGTGLAAYVPAAATQECSSQHESEGEGEN